MTSIQMKSSRPSPGRIVWPEGRDFAFTVYDDTDEATLANTRPVYDFLAEQGVLTTKSVWPLRNANDDPAIVGLACEDPEYLQWTLSLQASGHAIVLNTVAR